MTKLNAQKDLKQKRMWINLFFLFQPVNKLKMRDHEEPSFLLTSKNQMRRTYLATSSQAVKSKFPTRESFGEEIAKYFDMGLPKAKTDYWACTLEPHKEGGEHYHFSIKLSGTKAALVLKITFIPSIKYLSIFLSSMITTIQLLSTLVRVMRMFTLAKVIHI